MVTTNPENLFHKLAQRDRWNLKDMAKKDEWLLRTSTLLHKAGTHGPAGSRPALNLLLGSLVAVCFHSSSHTKRCCCC